MADIEVEFVTVEQRFWSGTATMVVAKTTEGEIGIQSGHEPLLGELDAGGTVTVYTDEGKKVAAVQGGFLSVTANKVSILGETAEWAESIDRAEAERALSEAGDDQQAAAAARGRLRAVEKAGS
ncbi:MULTISPECIES: F0F1 ATP synthase subunit epsilon [Dietzia]|uniref:ATP synthase epsilon chain n=1 Tax=Dietzia natronolimnaea TaxID=161920 RepID=A0A2A2WPJ0_9ACTN|nr:MULTISPECIES: F0F1 ATP synthase subunit epsilon [Dietzia]AVZ39688.1 F0F1 ATP synthase subunit epsilon [Dietzia sp. JS16-p6b]MBB1023384.1 F0F1 ATP synthase subunit epsilon [Dietzia sp. DQ12-76]MBB1026622.1 F0F1 ATP synthase subunit epsilon [Dietzia sp. DQ11-38-2]PAY23100.1 F0F1 ATP synthase subunit epsilon [Dietzia natronolimnaea]QGW25008.1 F0F1 ATP synthase subunit epsilon [Dietzia sp. DQ12-45-1b]